jgi:hypothetical protein
MCGFWRKIFGLEDKEVEVAKSGDNYYSVIKHKGEVLMTIVQPPTAFDGKTGGGGSCPYLMLQERFRSIDPRL